MGGKPAHGRPIQSQIRGGFTDECIGHRMESFGNITQSRSRIGGAIERAIMADGHHAHETRLPREGGEVPRRQSPGVRVIADHADPAVRIGDGCLERAVWIDPVPGSTHPLDGCNALDPAFGQGLIRGHFHGGEMFGAGAQAAGACLVDQPQFHAARLRCEIVGNAVMAALVGQKDRARVAFESGVDTGGTLSEGDTRINAEIGPQRLGNAALWRCPSAEGWPGTVQSAARSNDGRDALEGRGSYTWRDLDQWAAWESWGAGDGNGAARSMAYTPPPEDLRTEIVFAIHWSGEAEGTVELRVRGGATREAALGARWAAHAAGTTLTARWVQVQWRLTGDGSDVLSLDHLCWSVIAPTTSRRLLDANTADWPGSASNGRQVPHDLALVTDVDLTLQSVGAGWTWPLESKAPLRIRIFDGSGNPADAVVDIIIRGLTASN